MPDILKELLEETSPKPPKRNLFSDMPFTAKAQKPSKTMLEPEFEPHYQAWKDAPTPRNTANLLAAVDPVISAGLRTYGGGSATSPLLRSKAKLLSLSALERYNPEVSKLRTHLMINLQGLNRARAAEESLISVPERIRLEQGKLREATGQLADYLGREPSDAEISAKTGLSLAKLAALRKVRPAVATGQLLSPSDDGDEAELFSPGIVPRGDDAKTWMRFVYHDLDPYDKVILERAAGLHGKQVLPKKQIAALLGITPGAVSQRLARIQEKLDTRDTVGNLI